jgi:hypothetical protein
MPNNSNLCTVSPQVAETPRLSHWHQKAELDQRLTIKPWRVHDLRRSLATRLCDLGIAPHVVEQILNHQSGHKGDVAGIYNRSNYERETRNALALCADHVRSIIEGGERKVKGGAIFRRPLPCLKPRLALPCLVQAASLQSLYDLLIILSTQSGNKPARSVQQYLYSVGACYSDVRQAIAVQIFERHGKWGHSDRIRSRWLECFIPVPE